jgi:hypothetical protein
VTDFVNLNIKPAQSFGGVYRSRLYMYVFIWVSDHIYIRIYIYTVKKIMFDGVRRKEEYGLDLVLLSYGRELGPGKAWRPHDKKVGNQGFNDRFWSPPLCPKSEKLKIGQILNFQNIELKTN